jgi:hypothetical protein
MLKVHPEGPLTTGDNSNPPGTAIRDGARLRSVFFYSLCLVYLVYLVEIVYFVRLVCLVYLVFPFNPSTATLVTGH